MDSTINLKTSDEVRPAVELLLKVPPDISKVTSLFKNLLDCGYDVAVEQVFDETFFEPKLKYYELSITGSINIEEGET